jgi:hypothetical protein
MVYNDAGAKAVKPEAVADPETAAREAIIGYSSIISSIQLYSAIKRERSTSVPWQYIVNKIVFTVYVTTITCGKKTFHHQP